jgi:hypothetical protein
MIRSCALTAAAITLRIYLPLIFAFHWPFSIAYPAIARLCWIPNALAAEVYLRLVPRPSRITLPANFARSPQLPWQPAPSALSRRSSAGVLVQIRCLEFPGWKR